MQLNQKDIQILAALKANSRETLTMISRTTAIPIATVYDRIKRLTNELDLWYTVVSRKKLPTDNIAELLQGLGFNVLAEDRYVPNTSECLGAKMKAIKRDTGAIIKVHMLIPGTPEYPTDHEINDEFGEGTDGTD